VKAVSVEAIVWVSGGWSGHSVGPTKARLLGSDGVLRGVWGHDGCGGHGYRRGRMWRGKVQVEGGSDVPIMVGVVVRMVLSQRGSRRQ
jgi:hypothetical protein